MKKCYILLRIVDKYVALFTSLLQEQKLFTQFLSQERKQIYAFIVLNKLLKFLDCVKFSICQVPGSYGLGV